METNQVQMTTTLQFHVTFTLPSITLRLRALWRSSVNRGR